MKIGPHEFIQEKQSYGCDLCGCRYYCSACKDGSGMMGHSMQDDDGLFFACKEPDRAKAMHDKMFGRKK